MKHPLFVAVVIIFLYSCNSNDRAENGSNSRRDSLISRKMIDSAQILIDSEKWGEAKNVLLYAIQIKKTATAYNDLAFVLSNQNAPLDTVIFYIDKAKKTDPLYRTAYANLANYFLEIKQYKSCVDQIEQLLKLPIDGCVSCSKLLSVGCNDAAIAKDSLKDHTGAIYYLNKAIGFDTSNYLFQKEIGFEYYQTGQYSKAIEAVSKALKMHNDIPFAYELRGLSYCEIHNYTAALVDFDTLIKWMPESGRYYYDRGIAYKGMNMRSEALADFKRAKYFKEPGVEKIINELK